MASVTREGGSASEAAFMDEVVNQYHPDYRDDSKAKKRKSVDRARRGNFQMSQVLEEAIELRSQEIREVPLVNVDIDGMDFDDGSDLKSCSISYGPNGGGNYGLTGSIGGMKNKKGDIRVVLWNDFLEQVEFYFIPAADVPTLSTNTGSIRLSASTSTGVIKKLVDFRVDTFDDLVVA